MFKINYFLFPFIILLGLLLEKRESNKTRIIYIAVVLTVLLLEVALRGPSVGSDTPVYMSMFENIADTSWGELWSDFKRRYIFLSGTEDIGFMMVEKFVHSFISTNFHVYSFLIGLTFFIPLGVLIYKYSKNIYYTMFALIMYTALFHTIALAGGRQLYAIGFCIWAMMFVEQDKYKYAVLFVFIGVLFHMTALLFLGYIALNYFWQKGGKKLHFFSFFFIPFVLAFTNTIILFMADMSGNEKYRAYGEGDIRGGVFTFIVLMEFLSLFCFWTLNSKYIYDEHKDIGKMYNVLPFVTFFAPLIHSNGSMIRISMYYHIYMMQLVPIACERFFGKSQIRQYLFFIIILLVFMTLNAANTSYIFYWDDIEWWETDAFN